ncbi:MAG: hypothetical protein U0263_23285 [Polyangiaceae bacterium]
MSVDEEIDVSELVDSRRPHTELLAPRVRPLSVRRFRLVGTGGAASGKSVVSSADRLTLGSHPAE